MEFQILGKTDLKVSRLCLGSMTWGGQNTEAEARQQLDMALSEGINFLDTAESYPLPGGPGKAGTTEEIIGRWLKSGHPRDRVIIAGKVSGPPPRNDKSGRGALRLDRATIETALESSLRRLQTDYIDLYQVHWPDRDSNRFGQLDYFHAPEKDGAPISDTLECLDRLVIAGKVRYIGVSNETPWGVARYLKYSDTLGLTRIASIQNPYNLLNRTFDIGLAEFALREQVGLLAYSPSAFATLSGKYLGKARPANARLTLYPDYKRYNKPQADIAIPQYLALASRYRLDPVQMAIAFVLSRQFVTSAVIGATNLEQLRSNIDSISVKLPREMLKEIEKIHVQQPNPCP